MAESANALREYVASVAKAFSPAGTRRALLAVGSAAADIAGAERVDSLDSLVKCVVELMKPKGAAA